MQQVVYAGLKFTMPDDFDIHETDLNEAVKDTSASYKKWLKAELKRVGKSALLT